MEVESHVDDQAQCSKAEETKEPETGDDFY